MVSLPPSGGAWPRPVIRFHCISRRMSYALGMKAPAMHEACLQHCFMRLYAALRLAGQLLGLSTRSSL